jgi:hypothetical protein
MRKYPQFEQVKTAYITDYKKFSRQTITVNRGGFAQGGVKLHRA